MPRSELVCDGPVLDPLPAPDFCISASGLARTASRHPRYQRLGIGYRQHLCALHSAWRMEAKCLARWIYQSSRTPMQLVLIRPAHTHLWIHKPASLATRYVMGAR